MTFGEFRGAMRLLNEETVGRAYRQVVREEDQAFAETRKELRA